ncbi:hypothetical protein FRB90_002995, partial [Tulasnella sp. 427]
MHPATPCTPPPQSHLPVVHTITADDLEILNQITAPDFPLPTRDARFRRRGNDFDPLIIATAITGSDRSITRHHYLHGDIGIYSSDGPAKPRGPAQSQYVSQQKPRHQRLQEELAAAGAADASGVIRVPVPALSTQDTQTSLENPASPTVSPKYPRPSLPLSPKPSQTTVKSTTELPLLRQASSAIVADASSSSARSSSKPQHDSSAANSVYEPVS